MENKFNGVATTSLLVAAMRAAETNRSDAEGRLFSDPFAEKLAGPEGIQLLERALEEVGPQPAIAIRTAFIDEKVNQALLEGIEQIVILAAGMDSRAYRLTFPENAVVYELDQPEVLKYKKEKIGNVEPHCIRREIAVDLREEWQDKLIGAGFKKDQRTLFLVEGLLMYLSEEQAITLFKRINTLASSKDILLFDILSRTLLDSPFMKTQLDFLASLGAPWDFGTDEPEEFMKQFGWNATTTQAGEFAPDRWPFPMAPRHVKGVPRGYYVDAFKV